MKNSGTRGYSGYRGRTGGSKRWLILVLALIIFAGAAFLFLQHYRVYRSDGSSYIELPWFGGSAPTPQPDAGPPAEAETEPQKEG